VKVNSQLVAQEPTKKKGKKKQTGVSLITWATGEASVEAHTFKLYQGVTPVELLAFNPSKDELEKIYGKSYEQEPVYFGKRPFGETEVEYADCVFILKTSKETCGLEKILRLRLTIFNRGYSNKEQTKLQVVDKYNRTCWLSREEYKNRAIPIYKNGPAKIDAASYMPLYRGCLELNNFLRAYLGVADITVYDPTTGGQMLNPTPEKAEGIITHPEAFFKGDFSEITNILNMVKTRSAETGVTQKVKVMIGVNTNQDNRQFMEVFPLAFARYRERPSRATNTYRVFSWALNNLEGNSRVQNTEWYAGILREYKDNPTDLSTPAVPNSPESMFKPFPAQTMPAEPDPFADTLGAPSSDFPFNN